MSKQGSRETDLKASQDEIELALLMRDSQQGDSESYQRLLTRINEMLGRYVKQSFVKLGLASTGGHDDVVQDILLAIHSKRHTFDPEQFFLPWMYAIARYKIVDYIRKNGRRLRMAVPIDDELENIEVVMTHDFGSGLDVMALCDSLPEKQGQILKLVKLEGLSIAETSARTGYSPSDIKVSVHRALKALQKQIRESGYENK